MRLLLDTSAFLRFIAGSDRLGDKTRALMEDFDNALVLSVASLWEMAIKVSIGKLQLLKEFDSLIPEKLEENEIEVLPIRLAHLSEMIILPFHHRDPFDRLIIAQSIAEDLPLIAHDGVFKKYPVEIFPGS
uniref:PIN domain nuclease, a component of toxin-antitoxin system (PIN domain) n=1 Tax=Candidatus Kentrum eta TaxID=2126337 RepID=A0A450U700_9GAMM|nr:MAG: PIN domain nuclease, a component of toxin-antitoxin system (PIN domain) [Candidatus Kentron sp. H]VFJ89015.1 MAG: PIN domain nuclease, a component of toxin-antitoxin system (PIN domain) [Candidatus Kentron sp. H]VFJ95736.1 MAG: PIN domain nuclease, a component of toxin-antitoxin system (PIN domain) [Candidatus Kentron sp. H]